MGLHDCLTNWELVWNFSAHFQFYQSTANIAYIVCFSQTSLFSFGSCVQNTFTFWLLPEQRVYLWVCPGESHLSINIYLLSCLIVWFVCLLFSCGERELIKAGDRLTDNECGKVPCGHPRKYSSSLGSSELFHLFAVGHPSTQIWGSLLLCPLSLKMNGTWKSLY